MALSAADWTRIQRLRGARTSGTGATGDLTTNKDISPTMAPQLPYSVTMDQFKVVGTSKIRRPASKWTDYIASQTEQYVLNSKKLEENNSGFVKTLVRLCNCTSGTLNTKTGICTTCSKPTHIRIM